MDGWLSSLARQPGMRCVWSRRAVGVYGHVCGPQLVWMVRCWGQGPASHRQRSPMQAPQHCGAPQPGLRGEAGTDLRGWGGLADVRACELIS